MTQPPSKVFKLKPYPAQERGGRSVAIGVASLLMALFNLSLVESEGASALIFTLIFGVMGAQRLAVGVRLRALPEQDRAYRVSPEGLFKVLGGRDLARLDLGQVSALWLSEQRDTLYLLTSRGLQTLSADELARGEEWGDFTQHLERCLSTRLWAQGREVWEAAQQKSHALRRLRGAPAQTAHRLIALCVISLPATALLAALSGLTPSALLAAYPHLTYALFGGSAPWLLEGVGWSRLAVAPLANLDITHITLVCACLWWAGRPLERVWGGARLWLLFGGSLAVAQGARLALGALWEPAAAPLGGALAGGVAVLMALLTLLRHAQAGEDQLFGASRNALSVIAMLLVVSLSLLITPAAAALWSEVIAGALVGVGAALAWPTRSARTPSPRRLTRLAGTLLAVTLLAGATLYARSLSTPAPERLAALARALPSGAHTRVTFAALCAAHPACDADTRALAARELDRLSPYYPLTLEADPLSRALHETRAHLTLRAALWALGGSETPPHALRDALRDALSCAVVTPSSACGQRALRALDAQGARDSLKGTSPEGVTLTLSVAPRDLKATLRWQVTAELVEGDLKGEGRPRRLWFAVGDAQGARRIVSVPLEPLTLEGSHALGEPLGEGAWALALPLTAEPSAAPQQGPLFWSRAVDPLESL
jgi:membrane associated rhomboid family serine protease